MIHTRQPVDKYSGYSNPWESLRQILAESDCPAYGTPRYDRPVIDPFATPRFPSPVAPGVDHFRPERVRPALYRSCRINPATTFPIEKYAALVTTGCQYQHPVLQARQITPPEPGERQVQKAANLLCLLRRQEHIVFTGCFAALATTCAGKTQRT